MSPPLPYGLVGPVADPAPRLLEKLGFTLVPVDPHDAIARLTAGTVAGLALAGPVDGQPRLADTLTIESGGVVARSTLAEGLITALRRTSWGITDRPALILGTGTRAETIAEALVGEGVRHVRFAARSVGKAVGLLRRLQPLAIREGALVDLAPANVIPWELEDWRRGLVINATPVGLDDPEADPLWRFARVGREMRVIDLVHRPIRTALMRRAHRSKGEYLIGMAVHAEQALRRAELALGRPVLDVDAERIRVTP